MWKKLIFVASFFIAHVTSCLFLLPWANTAFQRQFDTGEIMTAFEKFGHFVSLVLSFPFATWLLTFHPARVSESAFLVSVILNSLCWSVCIFFVINYFFRKSQSSSLP